jgi:hypothetical protein
MSNIASPIDDVFAVGPESYADSPQLRNLGLIMLLLLTDWKGWTDRRVESVSFLDPDTVRRRVSVDFTIPALPTVIQRRGVPLQYVPVALLRKRRLIQFDLRDESGRVLPLVASKANGALAAATLVEAARAFARPGEQLPPPSILRDIWEIASSEPNHALKTWASLAQCPSGVGGDTAWREALTRSWRFMSLANDLARNFVVVTPLECHVGDRRVIKFAYTEPARIATTRRSSWRHGRTPKRTAAPGGTQTIEMTRRCTLTVQAQVEDGLAPLAGMAFTLTSTTTSQRTVCLTDEHGRWIDQVDAGSHTVELTTPSGLILTAPESTLTVNVERDTLIHLTFRPVPHGEEPSTNAISWIGRRREQVGRDPKTVEITAPAAGQARSYHLEYLVAGGMQATFATLSELPSAQPSEQAPPKQGRTDRHRASDDRVHLYLSDVPQEFTATATIKLRPRTSTVVRGGTFVSALSFAMIAVIRWRWRTLGVANLGTEVALLLAVPGGLSAYVARSQADRFTSIVLTGIRGLASASVVWCLLAATIVLIARAVSVDSHGLTHVGVPLSWTNAALGGVLSLNAATFVLMASAWLRSARPPEALTAPVAVATTTAP